MATISQKIARLARPHGLFVMGQTREGQETIVLLGTESGFWPIFEMSPEYQDNAADPLDRWSKRVIGDIADTLGALVAFPSDGPPYLPFIAWALASGAFHQSPVGMMVHQNAGLMISLRGALRLTEALEIPPGLPSPCLTCVGQPCLSSCPVDALGKTYQVDRCKTFLRTGRGANCRDQGCAARRACPISRSHCRVPAQSEFHMKAFLNT